MSGLAIGIGVHIQSVPAGAPVDIKTIAKKMREGTTRTAAMRELEAHGYLRRERVRLPSGRIVTRTVFCNQPGQGRAGSARPKPPTSRPNPEPRPEPEPGPEPESERKPVPHWPAVPHRSGGPPRPGGPPRRRALPAVPQPGYPAADPLLTAVGVLTELRAVDPRLLLFADDTKHLAPGVAAWLEREASSDAVRHALTADLPEPLYRPAALLAHRLTALLPAPPPFRAPRQHPYQICEGCERPFRAPASAPTLCRDCRTSAEVGHPRE
ncbi:helix-turn-helix domain-containing protein [Streptomyces sp. NPDC101115]|uniref:helix-turn-helix domain-containing protein n=1 Tax=Streptomyces sp. NPDC101115 TaxID=3366106 RepID=UPI0037FE0F21